MPTFIKTGFWEETCKTCKGYNGWLNLDEFAGSSGTSGNSGTSGLTGSSGTSGTTPSYPYPITFGLFSQTGEGPIITATTVESTLIDSGVGTLSVPANGFTVGDSFRLVMGGTMDAANNQTIRIRVKSGSTVFVDSGVQNLTSSITNDIWSLSVDFTIRAIGAAGVASIISIGRFNYTKINNGAVQGFGIDTLNNTTFDTTINNTLDITAQWGSNNAGNSIHSDVFTLNKVY